MIRPICVNCGVMYAVEKQGVVVANMASFGVAELISADRLQCPSCGHEIIGAFGYNPFAYHHDDNFAERLREAQDSGLIFLAFASPSEILAWEKAGKPI